MFNGFKPKTTRWGAMSGIIIIDFGVSRLPAKRGLEDGVYIFFPKVEEGKVITLARVHSPRP